MLSVLGIVTVCCLCFVLGHALSELQRARLDAKATPAPQHSCAIQHALTIIDAQPFSQKDGVVFSHIVGDSTVVLYRCAKCEAHAASILTGSWTVETLLLREARAPKEIAELERMAR